MNYQFQVPQKKFPTIDLWEDFYLREKRDSDVEDFLAHYSDKEVTKYIMCEMPRTIDEARRDLHYWRGVFYRNDGVFFAIADKKTDRLIGTFGLSGYNSYQSRIEISYDLNREYWRRGIISRALKEVLKLAFETWKVNRVEAYAAVPNEPSRNLLLKAGFTLEGVLRQHRYHLGRYVDVHSFSILREDLYQN